MTDRLSTGPSLHCRHHFAQFLAGRITTIIDDAEENRDFVCRDAGIDRARLTMIEAGTVNVSAHELLMLSMALQVSLLEFFRGVDGLPGAAKPNDRSAEDG